MTKEIIPTPNFRKTQLRLKVKIKRLTEDTLVARVLGWLALGSSATGAGSGMRRLSFALSIIRA